MKTNKRLLLFASHRKIYFCVFVMISSLSCRNQPCNSLRPPLTPANSTASLSSEASVHDLVSHVDLTGYSFDLPFRSHSPARYRQFAEPIIRAANEGDLHARILVWDWINFSGFNTQQCEIIASERMRWIKQKRIGQDRAGDILLVYDQLARLPPTPTTRQFLVEMIKSRGANIEYRRQSIALLGYYLAGGYNPVNPREERKTASATEIACLRIALHDSHDQIRNEAVDAIGEARLIELRRDLIAMLRTETSHSARLKLKEAISDLDN